MPRFRLRLTEEQIQLLDEAASYKLITIERLIVDASVDKAVAILSEFKNKDGLSIDKVIKNIKLE